MIRPVTARVQTVRFRGAYGTSGKAGEAYEWAPSGMNVYKGRNHPKWQI